MKEWCSIKWIEGRIRYEDMDHTQCRACGYDMALDQGMKLDGRCTWLELLEYLGPAEVRWNPSSGEAVLVYPDGTKISMNSGQANIGGKLFFKCALSDSKKCCMEAPEPEQT